MVGGVSPVSSCQISPAPLNLGIAQDRGYCAVWNIERDPRRGVLRGTIAVKSEGSHYTVVKQLGHVVVHELRTFVELEVRSGSGRPAETY